MRNEDRVTESKFRPDFSPGDEYVWKKSAKESRLKEDDREAGRDSSSSYRPSNLVPMLGSLGSLQEVLHYNYYNYCNYCC